MQRHGVDVRRAARRRSSPTACSSSTTSPARRGSTRTAAPSSASSRSRPSPSTPKSIPWLLLSAKSTTAGKFGDHLTKTTFIQRINTRGGLAPAASTCTAATAGTQKEVPYTADYFFWRESVA